MIYILGFDLKNWGLKLKNFAVGNFSQWEESVCVKKLKKILRLHCFTGEVKLSFLSSKKYGTPELFLAFGTHKFDGTHKLVGETPKLKLSQNHSLFSFIFYKKSKLI